MTKLQMLLTGLVLLVLCCGAMGCPPFRAALLGAAEECGPAVIGEVANILVKDTWREDLTAKATTLGASAVTCALRCIRNLSGQAGPATPD